MRATWQGAVGALHRESIPFIKRRQRMRFRLSCLISDEIRSDPSRSARLLQLRARGSDDATADSFMHVDRWNTMNIIVSRASERIPFEGRQPNGMHPAEVRQWGSYYSKTAVKLCWTLVAGR
jgi:hypothetical protein